MRKNLSRLVACLALFGAALAAPAEAGSFVGNIAGSTDATGSDYSGEFIYTPTNSTTATLTISLTNLTPAGVGGFLTAFVFNVPDAVTGVTLDSASPATMDTFFFSPDNINAQPFGQDYDAGLGVGGNANSVFEGGGNPSNGIPVGGTGAFTFTVTGTNLNTLTQQSFFIETPSGGPFFVARFRGLTGGGSDKVPAVSIPEPSTLTLAGLGGLGVIGLVRRRWRAV